MRVIIFQISIILSMLLVGCREFYGEGGIDAQTDVTQETVINPYPSGSTIPCNISPLNLAYKERGTTSVSVIDSSGTLVYFDSRRFRKQFRPSAKKWREWLLKARGGKIEIMHESIKHTWFVATESIDKYIFYRKTFLNEDVRRMFVEQHDLEEFTEKILIENSKMNGTCINCHNGRNNNVNYSLLHIRSEYQNMNNIHEGTYLIRDGKTTRIKADESLPPHTKLVYWDFNPREEIIVFSTNQIGGAAAYQRNGHADDFMTDTLGTIIIYDIEKNNFITNSEFSDTAEYSFPIWSGDGKTLYYCRGPKRNLSRPWDFLFDLYSITFDNKTGTFGKETLIFPFSECGVSVTMPRPVPNTSKLIVTVHKTSGSIPLLTDGDYYILDLSKTQDTAFGIGISGKPTKTVSLPKGLYAKIEPVESVNTPDHEKYHSFSSNGRWMVFSSGRLIGEQSVPHIVYVDREGNFGKPFALPQKEPLHYTSNVWSYVYPNTSTAGANFNEIENKLK
ncbi:MAG: hypothetical protein LBG17_09525 [Bacteroidales bacterium]|jgi:hypothetical protein|nr:hypothetical protein [Bacteroidales bacterium]